jgi:CheY-like chemotaxis protein
MPVAAGTTRILVVDDEESIRSFAYRVLRGAGYEVVVASDGPEALTLDEKEGPFDLFVIDVVMPHMMGNDLARRLRARSPDVKVLYFTGYSDRLFQEKSTLWANEAFLEKPVPIDGLLQAVSLLLFGHTRGPQRGPAEAGRR